MKLLTKYNRVNSLASVIIFLAGCVAFYFVLHYVLIRQLDKSLLSEKTEILQHINAHNTLPEIVNTEEEQTTFSILNKPSTAADNFKSVEVLAVKEKEMEWRRTLTFDVLAGGQWYRMVVVKSQEETEELVQLIVLIAIAMIAMIVLAGFIINRIILGKLWRPFYNTVQLIGNYRLSGQHALNLPVTNIEEFALLNNSFNQMAEKVSKEYDTLKEFTGNAAHEMQTPLAVIATHTEALMQDEAILQKHHISIETIGKSVNKLSRLNQSLLLLAKIENQQFPLIETVHWKELIENKLEELSEVISNKNIRTELNLAPVATLFHTHLADIVIGNLINNAIRYNVNGGAIALTLTKDYLLMENTSDIPSLEATKLGNRFYRHPQTTSIGTGLGLSIIYEICTVAGYQFSYAYVNQRHQFRINF